jgi:non-specific serine/threonine protein kinase
MFLTSFVGRQREIADVATLLLSTRLLTLTGAGGCGKTRLAVELARRALTEFPDGTRLVDLTPLAEPSLVAQTVATALDIRQSPNRTLVESIGDQVRHRRMLLLLDNCEHVVAAAAELARTLLGTAPLVTILATSRENLGVDGETTWRVPSLTFPDTRHGGSVDELLQFDAVRLLTERAVAAGSTFAVTSANAAAVSDVCRRLDGIPLAIELAAARLKVLSIEQINERLDDRFRLLTRPERAPLGRQRTLEATVDWSYNLLSDAERELARRLSTFAGGWTLEAAERVCTGEALERDDVLDLMSRLIDKSLVMADSDFAGARRYRFLETVRHYLHQRLQQSGEADAIRYRHFTYFHDLARRAEPELTRAAQFEWLDRLQAEHDNLRGALEWRLSGDDRSVDTMELATALHWFWLKRAYLAEGQQWLERALASVSSAAPDVRAQALMTLGNVIFFRGDFERAASLLEESTALARVAGRSSIVALARGLQTMSALESGDSAAAAQFARESREAALAAGEPWLECFALSYFAYEALYSGDVDRASELHERALALLRTRGELWGMGIVLFDLALLRVVQQRYAEARALSTEGIALGQKFGDQRAIAWCLGVLASVDAAEGHPVRAAHLRGAMEGLLDSIGSSVQPSHNELIGDRLFAAVQQQLGAEPYQQALAAGRTMSLPHAIRYALERT